MARATLAELGRPADSLLAADLSHIWASPAAEVDAEEHERALRAALSMDPGHERDARLGAALAEEGELLADEPYADWALRPRERLAALRQEARLALARDRAKGAGDSRPEAVLAAFQACFEHDPASEEVAGALVTAYFAHGHRELAVRAYERCRAALEELGLGPSPWLEEVYATAAFEAAPSRPAPVPAPAAVREELRTVSVLAAEVAAPGGPASVVDPESLRDAIGRCLTAVIAEVEALGGTVTSVSGQGLQAMFGAPEAHEDDPERAVRAAFRSLSAVAAMDGGKPALRIGVETGPAVLGPIGGGARVEYGAVGEVVGQAAALQSAARPGSALVGPATRTATEHLFTWGASQVAAGPAPLTATYLGKPRPRAAGRRFGPGGRGPLVGRQAELAALGAALREAVRGHGSVVLVTGEPGLGKTRLGVQECRGRGAWGEGPCGWRGAAPPTPHPRPTACTSSCWPAGRPGLWCVRRASGGSVRRGASECRRRWSVWSVPGWTGQPAATVRPARAGSEPPRWPRCAARRAAGTRAGQLWPRTSGRRWPGSPSRSTASAALIGATSRPAARERRLLDGWAPGLEAAAGPAGDVRRGSAGTSSLPRLAARARRYLVLEATCHGACTTPAPRSAPPCQRRPARLSAGPGSASWPTCCGDGAARQPGCVRGRAAPRARRGDPPPGAPADPARRLELPVWASRPPRRL